MGQYIITGHDRSLQHPTKHITHCLPDILRYVYNWCSPMHARPRRDSWATTFLRQVMQGRKASS
jgi:hypothetical protein